MLWVWKTLSRGNVGTAEREITLFQHNKTTWDLLTIADQWLVSVKTYRQLKLCLSVKINNVT